MESAIITAPYGHHTHEVVVPASLVPLADALREYVSLLSTDSAEARDAAITAWVRGVWAGGETVVTAEGETLSLAARVSRVQRACRAEYLLEYRDGAECYRRLERRWVAVDRDGGLRGETWARTEGQAVADLRARARVLVDVTHDGTSTPAVPAPLARERIALTLDRG